MKKDKHPVDSSNVVDMFSYSVVKRIFDFIFSLIFIIILIPFFILISLAILISSGFPILYSWKIVGINGRQISSWKFRTMVKSADLQKEKLLNKNEMDGPLFKIKKDPRITKFGKILRKFSIDELPQLFSVFKGDMSLVGPRPPLQAEWKSFNEKQKLKMSVKPGMTGLWQVSGRNKINTFEDIINYDLKYINSWSLTLDLKILFKTIPAIIKGTGY